MCFNKMKIKAVNPSAPKFAFVPCGKCEECRNSVRSAWSFRLSAELEDCVRKGWRIGFCTLTYNDVHLPHLPKSLWRDCTKYKPVPCFSRSDVRNLILSLRKKLWRDFGVKAIKYMVCSEYGPSTQRPHYHAIFSFPPVVSAKVFHGIVKQFWQDKGFVFPQNHLGGVDSKGYNHKPFEVPNCSARFAAKYAGKYCCKDISYLEIVPFGDIDTKSKLWRDCSNFHVQSRSLGFNAIKDLTDEQRLKVYLDGFSFVGEDRLLQIPVYLKNKIIFDNYYVIKEDGTRLCRRRANKFFVENAPAIFQKKVKFYEQILDNACSSAWWHTKGFESFYCIEFSKIAQFGKLKFADDNSSAAASFLAYYGVDFDLSLDLPFYSQWLTRYEDKIYLEQIPTIDFNRWWNIKCYFDFLFSAVALANSPSASVDVVDLVSDYWKSCK